MGPVISRLQGPSPKITQDSTWGKGTETHVSRKNPQFKKSMKESSIELGTFLR